MAAKQRHVRLVAAGAFIFAPATALAADEQPPALPGDSTLPSASQTDIALTAPSTSFQIGQSTDRPVTKSGGAASYQTLVFGALALLLLFTLIMALSSRQPGTKRRSMQLALFFGLLAIFFYLIRGTLFPSADQTKVVGTSLRPEVTLTSVESSAKPGQTLHFTVLVKNTSEGKSSNGLLTISGSDFRLGESAYKQTTEAIPDISPGGSRSFSDVSVLIPTEATGKVIVRATVSWQVIGKDHPGRSVAELRFPLTSPSFVVHQGYGMYSFPYSLNKPTTIVDLASSLKFNKYMYTFDTTANNWVNSFDKKTAINKAADPRAVFILYSDKNEELLPVPDFSAYPNVASSASTTLLPGWNLIGNPYPRPVSVDNITLNDTGATGTVTPTPNSAHLSIADSFAAGSISPVWFLVTRDGKQQYEAYNPVKCTPSKTDSCSPVQIDVGEAVWIKNKTSNNIDLHFSPPKEPVTEASSGGLTDCAGPRQVKVLYGDLNNDGKIDVSDVNLLHQVLDGTVDASKIPLSQADLSPVCNNGFFGDHQLTFDDWQVLYDAVVNGTEIVPGMTVPQLLHANGNETVGTNRFVVDPKVHYGDVNGDGKVDQADIDALMQMIRDKKQPAITDPAFQALDLAPFGSDSGQKTAGDGVIDESDALVLAQIVDGNPASTRTFFGINPSTVAASAPIETHDATIVKNPIDANVTTSSPGGLYGDANGDGKVNIQDAIAILQMAVGMIQKPDASLDRFRRIDVAPYNLDPNVMKIGDGKITIEDAIVVMRMMTGLIDPKLFSAHGKNSSAITLLAGDTNGDGKIDLKDATLVNQYVVANCLLKTCPVTSANYLMDANLDGKISFADAVLVLQLANGNGTAQPAKNPQPQSTSSPAT